MHLMLKPPLLFLGQACLLTWPRHSRPQERLLMLSYTRLRLVFAAGLAVM